MSDFIFEHYVGVSQIVIAGVLPVMLVAVAMTRKSGRLQAVAVSVAAYVAIVALGMSSDIKHLTLVGVAHALLAFAIAAFAVRHLNVGAAWLLMVPCFFILVVVLFNFANQGIGLELMGRWNRSG